jgi:hypothetical protein
VDEGPHQLLVHVLTPLARAAAGDNRTKMSNRNPPTIRRLAVSTAGLL